MTRVFFYLAVFLSLLSQLPMVLESGLDAYLKLSWIPLTAIIVSKYPSDLFNRKLLFFFIFVIVFGCYLLMMQSLTVKEYITLGGDYYNIVISFLIFVDCFVFWKYNNSEKDYKILVWFMMLGCMILGIVVYVFFIQYADITSMTYAYDAKNSLAQILFVGCVMTLTSINLFHSKIARNILIVCMVLLFLIIMLLKSRATILCVAFVMAYYMTEYGTKKQRKYLCLVILGAILFILLNEAAYQLVVVNILFANRDASSASSLSSGRSELIMKALEIVSDNYIFGIGYKYLDCMPISILLQYGGIGLIIVATFLLILAVKVLNLNRNTSINMASFLIFWSFIINSLFEAYPPFGPGVKCFPLWMLLGFAFAKKKIETSDLSHNRSLIRYLLC